MKLSEKDKKEIAKCFAKTILIGISAGAEHESKKAAKKGDKNGEIALKSTAAIADELYQDFDTYSEIVELAVTMRKIIHTFRSRKRWKNKTVRGERRWGKKDG